MRELCQELEMDPAAARSVGEAIDHGERGIAFEALYDAWERGPRGTDPLRCAEALRRMAEILGFREEAEALAGLREAAGHFHRNREGAESARGMKEVAG